MGIKFEGQQTIVVGLVFRRRMLEATQRRCPQFDAIQIVVELVKYLDQVVLGSVLGGRLAPLVEDLARHQNALADGLRLAFGLDGRRRFATDDALAGVE